MLTEGRKAKAEAYNAAVSADSAAKKRLAALFDDGIYNEIGAYALHGNDPAGAVAAYGFVNGVPVYAFSQDSSVKSGAVTKAQAAKICRVMELAARNGTPVVGIYDSCGAYAEDGADALNSYGDILAHTSALSGVVPQIAVIAGVCSGSAAMIAVSADFVIMSKEGSLYMAPGINAGSADEAEKAGTVSVSAENDTNAIEAAKKLISLMPRNNLSPVPEFEYGETSGKAVGSAGDIASAIADKDSLFELSEKFGTAAFTALASVGGQTVGIAATNKTDAKLTADDCTKLARFVRLCDAFSIPVLTIVDTEGFEANSATEAAGAVRSIAKTAGVYAEATTVKLSLITGKAYGAAFVALAGSNANADMTFAYPEAEISAMDPVSAAEFLYHDELKGASDVKAKRAELAARYADEYASVYDAAAKSAVDGVISPENARTAIISALDISAGKRLAKRLPKKHSNSPF